MSVDYPKYPRLDFEKDKRRKLTKEDIIEIPEWHKRGKTQKWIAEYFGVSATCIWRVLNPELAKQKNKALYEYHKKRYEENPELLKRKRDASNAAYMARWRTEKEVMRYKYQRTLKWKRAHDEKIVGAVEK